MTEVSNVAEKGGKIEFDACKGIGDAGLNEVVQAVEDVREMKATVRWNGSTQVDNLNQLTSVSETLFGERSKSWKTAEAGMRFATAVGRDGLISQAKKDQINREITLFEGHLLAKDNDVVVRELKRVEAVVNHPMNPEDKRKAELLLSGMEMLLVKWQLEEDIGRVEQLQNLRTESDIVATDDNIKEVEKATAETRKNDNNRDRVREGVSKTGKSKRRARNVWYTERWQSVVGKKIDKEMESVDFIRQEIDGNGGLLEKADKLDRKYNGVAHWKDWKFFDRNDVNGAIKGGGLGYIEAAVVTLELVLPWVEEEWSRNDGILSLEDLGVREMMVRGVYRVCQENVRAGFVLMEKDISHDPKKALANPVFTEAIVRNKGIGIFEYAVDPRERERMTKRNQDLHDAVLPSFEVAERAEKKLKDMGKVEGSNVIIEIEGMGEIPVPLNQKGQGFEPMFCYEKKRDGTKEVNFDQFEYRIWLARVSLFNFIHRSLPMDTHYFELSESGISPWMYIFDQVVTSDQDLLEKITSPELKRLMPQVSEFWLLQLYLNEGRDIAKELKNVDWEKQGAAEMFKEIAHRYFHLSWSKTGEVGPDINLYEPISPELTRKKWKNLREGRMIWKETKRPMMINLQHLFWHLGWQATTHRMEWGDQTYGDWLTGQPKGSPDDPYSYIGLFPTFIQEKIGSGLAFMVSLDAIWWTMGLHAELYPLVKKSVKLTDGSIEDRWEILASHDEAMYLRESSGELSQAGELLRIYRRDVRRRWREYMANNMGSIEKRMLANIQMILGAGKAEAGSKEARAFVSRNIMQLANFLCFNQTLQETWCGSVDAPNEFYQRKSLVLRRDGTVKKSTVEPRPLDLDLHEVWRAIRKPTHQEGAALILTGVPEKVINRHARMVIFGRQRKFNKPLEKVDGLARQIWGSAKKANYFWVMRALAASFSPEEVGEQWGKETSANATQVAAMESFAEEVMTGLQLMCNKVFSPQSFYEMVLFSWAREQVKWYDNYRFFFDPYLADMDVLEEITTWKFNAGPRGSRSGKKKAEHIIYHPLLAGDDGEQVDDFFNWHTTQSFLSYDDFDSKGRKTKRYRGDYILTMAMDTMLPANDDWTDELTRMWYCNLGGNAQYIPTAIHNRFYDLSRASGILKDHDWFRPGVEFAHMPKLKELWTIIENAGLHDFDAKTVEKMLYRKPYFFNWVWAGREVPYFVSDLLFGQLDAMEQFTVKTKETASGVLGMSPIVGQVGNFFINGIASPVPQLRALLPAAAMTLLWTVPVFGLASQSWWVAALGASYSMNLFGRGAQLLFGKLQEDIANNLKQNVWDIKDHPVLSFIYRRDLYAFRRMPDMTKPKEKRLMASQRADRVIPTMLNATCMRPGLYHDKSLPEGHTIARREKTREKTDLVTSGKILR